VIGQGDRTARSALVSGRQQGMRSVVADQAPAWIPAGRSRTSPRSQQLGRLNTQPPDDPESSVKGRQDRWRGCPLQRGFAEAGATGLRAAE